MSELTLPQTTNQIYSLRVNQLDAKLLDEELFSIIEANLNQIQVERLKDVAPELLALIKAYLWYNTIERKSSSIGHLLLQLKYYDLSQNERIGNHLTKWQSYGVCIVQLILPWIKMRISTLTKNERMKNSIEIIEYVYRTLDLFNDFIFLYNGKYRSLWERLLKIGTGRQSVDQNENNSELFLETMNRELLWHTFAEFLTFVLPLINLYRLKNSLNNFMRIYVFNDQRLDISSVSQRQSNDLKICVICHQWPVDAHEIGCRHVFCYYCLMSNFLSDQINGFTCDNCFYKIDSIDSIKRAKISKLN